MMLIELVLYVLLLGGRVDASVVTIGNNEDGPGIGFLFSSLQAQGWGMSLLGWCSQATLDGSDFYFYVYGCAFNSSTVATMSRNSSFVFASDKSITTIMPPRSGLLLANVWPLRVKFMTEGQRNAAAKAAKSPACNVVPQGDQDLVLSCSGGLTCSGCIVRDFWSWKFVTATFDPAQ